LPTGGVRLVGIRALQGGPFVGQALRTLREHIPTADARVAAIYRAGKSIRPEGETVIETATKYLSRGRAKTFGWSGRRCGVKKRRLARVVIAGGAHRLRLASELEDKNQVKLIERDSKRARRVSDTVEPDHRAAWRRCPTRNAARGDIDSTDVFAALDHSKANILQPCLAKRSALTRSWR